MASTHSSISSAFLWHHYPLSRSERISKNTVESTLVSSDIYPAMASVGQYPDWEYELGVTDEPTVCDRGFRLVEGSCIGNCILIVETKYLRLCSNCALDGGNTFNPIIDNAIETAKKFALAGWFYQDVQSTSNFQTYFSLVLGTLGFSIYLSPYTESSSSLTLNFRYPD